MYDDGETREGPGPCVHVDTTDREGPQACDDQVWWEHRKCVCEDGFQTNSNTGDLSGSFRHVRFFVHHKTDDTLEFCTVLLLLSVDLYPSLQTTLEVPRKGETSSSSRASLLPVDPYKRHDAEAAGVLLLSTTPRHGTSHLGRKAQV